MYVYTLSDSMCEAVLENTTESSIKEQMRHEDQKGVDVWVLELHEMRNQKSVIYGEENVEMKFG